jgi:methylated-DNA-[protein]-cysteine S-methyltransferase
MATYFKTMDSPLGVLKLSSDEQCLKSVSFDAESTEITKGLPKILIYAQKQLEEYFSGSRQEFDLPIDPEGTEFQQRVWVQVGHVNYGSTKCYGEIAKSLGSWHFCRAVGMANGRNPLPIIIPCHRIIGYNGKMTGYAGGLERKKWLLLHERENSWNSGLF